MYGGTLIDDDESDWTRPPFWRPPAPVILDGPPTPTDNEFELMRPILDNGLGTIVESLHASQQPVEAIAAALFRDHGVEVAPHAVGRYMLHIQIVRKLHKIHVPVHPALDAAIVGRQKELADQAPEDLKRIDRAIDFLDRVVRGDPEAIGFADENIVLRERVKASKEVVAGIKSKYEVTKRKLIPEDAGKVIDLVSILKQAYGPAVQIQPKRPELIDDSDGGGESV